MEKKEKQDDFRDSEATENVEIIDNDEEIKAETEDNNNEEDNSELASLQVQNKQLEDRALRVQAEFENFKKRTQREKEANQKYKSQDIVHDLLPVIDSFNRALETEVAESALGFKEGVEMVYRQFDEALKNHGVEEIKTIGEEFDPNLHHAVMQAEEPGYESNIVVEELQKGYMLKERVIRPAMVKVNK